jgi:hypothetical protein
VRFQIEFSDKMVFTPFKGYIAAISCLSPLSFPDIVLTVGWLDWKV